MEQGELQIIDEALFQNKLHDRYYHAAFHAIAPNLVKEKMHVTECNAAADPFVAGKGR